MLKLSRRKTPEMIEHEIEGVRCNYLKELLALRTKYAKALIALSQEHQKATAET